MEYRELWNLAGELAEPGGSPSSAFGDLGLYLEEEPHNWEYWCTPVNSRTFASTGGDGVHYGFVSLQGSAITPIVMTIPMCDTPNIIVGENLREFLALGCRIGFFSLERLVYSREETIRALAWTHFGDDVPENELRLLEQISSRFDLSPWANPEARLAELSDKYDSLLVTPEEGS